MDSGNAADGGSLKLDSIPILDLRLLSQSELYSLSLCSSTAFDPRRCDDVVIPKIDRSVFNESAGSRKQTYSRLRLAPPSSSSSTSTPRRRTPHLRSAATTFARISHNNSDPENAENSHIVSLLKQLFVTDLNPEELVPVKIDYSVSPPVQQLSSFPPSSQSLVCSTGHKRKRGRPRREESLRNEGDLPPGVSVADVSGDADGFSLLNEVFLRENMEDKDREVLNKDGVAVDLVALGAEEHPYREDIRRRTEGLTTEEELLEFLTGLSGEWGSRRKKKRTVDANEFGAALPVGWKLSLSVKKKNGQVWLYCRRYISPSGLHFVSCKGVSSYLLSLHGVQDTSLPNSFQHYEIVNSVDKFTPVTVSQIPDFAVKDEHRKENVVSDTSSPAVDSTSGNYEMQVVKNNEDFPKVGVGELLHCNQCNITFNRKDELLQHQSSQQRNRLQNGTCITDGVITKDGKYECQFCPKTFGERHGYNGHVGTHIKCQAKTAGESPAGNMGESVDPCSVGGSVDLSSFSEFPVQDTAMQGLLNSDTGENICSPGNRDNEKIGYLMEANRDAGVVGETNDIVSKTDQCEVANVIISSNSNKSFHNDENANNCAAEITADASSCQGRRSANCSPSPVDTAATHGLKNVDVIENSSGTEKLEQCVVSRSSLLDSNQHVEECINNDCISEARNEVKLDSENLSVHGSMFNFFGTDGDNPSTSESMLSKLDLVPNVNMLPRSLDEDTCDEDNVPDLISKCNAYERCGFGICEKRSCQVADDAVSRHGEARFGISSVTPSWNDPEKVPKKSGVGLTSCLLEEPVVQNACESRLVALSSHESMDDLDHNDDEVCGRKNQVSKFDHYQTSGNGESTNRFSSSHNELNSYSVIGTLQDIQVGAVLSSTTNGQSFEEDNMMRIFDGPLEEQRQEQSRGVSLCQSGNNPGNHFKLNKIENTGQNELSLSFGNYLTEKCTDSSRVEQKRYQAGRVNIQSVFHRPFGDQTNLSARNSNIPGDLIEGRPLHGDIPDSPFNIKMHKLGYNFNAAHPRDQMRTSGRNCMDGFGSGSSQPGDGRTADDPWRTGHENAFEGTFDATARLQIPSSNCFGTFGLTSDKGEEGSFGVNKNYNIHTDSVRPGRTELVEYRFLGKESSTCMPEESKIFSYTPNTEPGLDPSFWLGKDALTLPYTTHTNQVSSICVWCRNMFFHQPDDFGAHAGAIGSMCPSCSSKIPGQFNVL